jgi:hypothetical protein
VAGFLGSNESMRSLPMLGPALVASGLLSGCGGNTLSVDAGEQAVYVTRADGTTERWARLRPGQGCA